MTLSFIYGSNHSEMVLPISGKIPGGLVFQDDTNGTFSLYTL